MVDRRRQQGFSFYGAARTALHKVTQGTGLEWSIQNQQLQVVRRRGTTRRKAVVLAGDTGLIGYPERTREAAREKARVRGAIASSWRVSARHGQMRLPRASGKHARFWRSAMRPSRKLTNGARVPSGPPMEGCAMRRFKTMACGLMLMLGANGCAPVPPAPAPAVECPTPAPPPAWIMEPAPNLIPPLDRIISPSGPGSSN